MSKSYGNWCPEVYRSVFIDRYNDNFVRVAPCCQAVPKLESVDTFDFFTSPYLSRLREEFSKGQQPNECEWCWKVEMHGQKSRRLSAIEFFEAVEPDTTVELQSLDYNATWACNLACIMCDSHSSSFWAVQENLSKQDLKQLGRLFRKKNQILDKLDVGKIKKIHFNGGEPLTNGDQHDLLAKIEQQGILNNVFISYNTNGTLLPDQKIVDLWSRTRLVKLFFSIDATGPAYEYIRWPGKWHQVTKNILDMKSNLPSNVMFGFNVTVGAYNVLELPTLYEWFAKNISTNREGDASDFCWQFAIGFDPKQLPTEVKKLAIEMLEPITIFKGIVSYLQSNINYVADLSWTDRLQELDAKRKTDWKNALLIAKFIKEETTC